MNAFDQAGQGSEPSKHRRRPRYRGTHPKSYEHKYKEHDLEAYPEIEAHVRAKGNTPAGTHIPVLVQEVMEDLHPAPGDVVVDCTVGYGGHALEFMKRIAPDGRLIALDVDGAQLERTQRQLEGQVDVAATFHQSNFAGVAKVLRRENLDGCDILFADLGVSSMQIDNPARGMSYKHEGPLDMRMDDRREATAGDLLHSLSERELAEALRELADEPDHERIARLIVQRRRDEPITQTTQLVRLIFDAKGLTPQTWRKQRESQPGVLHPAARTFQALRILVNDELGALRELLRQAPYCLRPVGRIGIISFHSGEDRLVKHAFRDGVRGGIYAEVAREVIVSGRLEVRTNPRSASAKFRWAVKP